MSSGEWGGTESEGGNEAKGGLRQQGPLHEPSLGNSRQLPATSSKKGLIES